MLPHSPCQPTLEAIQAQLAPHNLRLIVSKKRVKNINFRVKNNTLMVSAPWHVSENVLVNSIATRLNWAIQAQRKLQTKQHHHNPLDSLTQHSQVYLWGEPYQLVLQHDNLLKDYHVDNQNKKLYLALPNTATPLQIQQAMLVVYRHQLSLQLPKLLAHWQPKVGKTAQEVRLKKMHTRWGSCNVRAGRVWLSVYLAQHPVECTAYVLVHELCHLHHANHSAKFWSQVKRAMPDYQTWHDHLKNKDNPKNKGGGID